MITRLIRWTFILVLVLPRMSLGQSGAYTVDDFAGSITPQDLRLDLSVLASDALEGRETGTEGNDKAAQFIASQFKGYGIPPCTPDGSYYQEVPFSRSEWAEVSLNLRETALDHPRDFLCIKSLASRHHTAEGREIVFAGYGISDPRYDDYDGLDVRGKAVLIYTGEPVSAKGKYRLTGTREPGEWSRDWDRKVRVAGEKGAVAVFILVGDFKEISGRMRRFNVGSGLTPGKAEPLGEGPVVTLVSSTTARLMMGDRVDEVLKARDRVNRLKKAKPVTLDCPFRLTVNLKVESITSNNVLGYIEGTDPTLSDELVVVSAHYDHLGKRGEEIFNGANDNGSGTSTVMEIAQAFALAKSKGTGPRRSVLALLVTGEEKGLLGSKYYVEHPVFPLDKTVVDVNIDMVGRIDDKHKDNPHYIYVIGSDRLSTDLHRIDEEVNAAHSHLELDYTYNAKDDPNRYYQRSDHYHFAENGIPAIFFFNGSHEDYHRPTDTIEKIDFDIMAEIGRHVFRTAWALANRDERIRVDVVQP